MTPIEDGEPATWQDLELSVARILSESGLRTERGKLLTTVRGSVEVDVYAEDQSITPPVVTLVECKHWKSAIPQTIVHAFRTTVVDSGANVGFIVSLRGFQSGAVNAAELTNIHLVDWYVFQSLFAERWYRNYAVRQMEGELDPLFEYTEPINSRIFRKADALPGSAKKEFGRLRDKHSAVGMLLPLFFFAGGTLAGMPDVKMPDLPLGQRLTSDRRAATGLPPEILDAQTLRALLEAVTAYARLAIAEFDEVFGERA